MVSIPSLIRQSVADHSPFPGLTNEPRIRLAAFSESHQELTRRSSPISIRHSLPGACGARGRRRARGESLSFGFEALSISFQSISGGGDDNLLQSPDARADGRSSRSFGNSAAISVEDPPPTPKRTRIHYLPPASLPRLTRKLPRHAAAPPPADLLAYKGWH